MGRGMGDRHDGHKTWLEDPLLGEKPLLDLCAIGPLLFVVGLVSNVDGVGVAGGPFIRLVWVHVPQRRICHIRPPLLQMPRKPPLAQVTPRPCRFTVVGAAQVAIRLMLVTFPPLVVVATRRTVAAVGRLLGVVTPRVTGIFTAALKYKFPTSIRKVPLVNK